MINVFYEELPCHIAVDGREYGVITDFREWIRFSDMIKSGISANIKLDLLSEMFVSEVPDIYTERGFDAAIEGIVSFLSMEALDFPSDGAGRSEGGGRRGIYYDYDAPFIISAFLQDYGIDLLEIPYLHWWKFKMLLDGISEDRQIKERIYYRTVDTRSIKNKHELKRILRIRRKITLPEEEYVSDGEIGNVFV